MTFYELYKIWRETKGLYVKRSTLSCYDLSLQNRILPALGAMDVSEIKTVTLQSFLNKILSDGLSVKSANDTIIIVKMILRYGADMELVPFRKFNLKYPSRNIDDIRAIDTYTIDEQKKITQYVISNPSPRNLGILIALCTGMRIGEICALKWENVDFDNKLIKVRNTVQRIYLIDGEKRKTEVEFNKPKTFDSNRDIPIQKDLYGILKKYKAIANEDYFVISGSSRLIEPRTYRNYYNEFILNQVKLDRCIKFHGLRHTFATRLVENGAEVTAVSKIMGHSNVSITMNLYVHPTAASKSDCINKSMKGFF
jgi:integrase|nr:MAG TPA: Integrase [Caudoviricetes sp.]